MSPFNSLPNGLPKCSAVKHALTPEQFESLAHCVLDAVASVEGWDSDEHPSFKYQEGEMKEPSRAFLAELRRRLPRHYRVLPRKKAA